MEDGFQALHEVAQKHFARADVGNSLVKSSFSFFAKGHVKVGARFQFSVFACIFATRGGEGGLAGRVVLFLLVFVGRLAGGPLCSGFPRGRRASYGGCGHVDIWVYQ